MASYPNSIFDPRTKENKSGVVYDAAKKTVVFAEDLSKLDDEVVAVEEELGENLENIKRRSFLFDMMARANLLILDFLTTYDHIETYTSGTGIYEQTYGLANVKTGATAGGFARQNVDWAGITIKTSGNQDGYGALIYLGLLTGNKLGFWGSCSTKITETQSDKNLTASHAGIFYEDGTWYASVADGTTQYTEEISISGTGFIEIKRNAAGEVEFYWNNVLKATLTVGNFADSTYLQMFVNNKSEDADGRIYMYRFGYVQKRNLQ